MKKQKGIIILLILILGILSAFLILILCNIFFGLGKNGTGTAKTPFELGSGFEESGKEKFSGVEDGNVPQLLSDSNHESTGPKEQSVALGEPLARIKETIEQLGGAEIDISQEELGYDGWLRLFKTSDLKILCHFTEKDITDMVAVYEEGILLRSEGTKPVSLEMWARYETATNGNFADFVGYLGENFSEDEYVYFTDGLYVIIYDTTENAARLLPLPETK